MPLALLALPFAFVLAQLVVRYAYAPVPITADAAHVMPGKGTLIEVELARDAFARVSQLSLRYPDGLKPISPLVRAPLAGKAFQQVVATAPGEYAIELALGLD